jgi:hypothetical protein
MWLLSSAARRRETCRSHAMARHGAPGAIPTVDFLLYRLAAVVKKMSVKSHVGVVLAFTRQIARGMAETPEPCRSGADARMRMC